MLYTIGFVEECSFQIYTVLLALDEENVKKIKKYPKQLFSRLHIFCALFKKTEEFIFHLQHYVTHVT